MAKVQTKIAERYARALMRIISSEKLDSVHSSLKSLSTLFENKSIARVLNSPVVQPDLKAKILATALGQINAEPRLIQFSSNIAKAGRTSQIQAITEAFERLLNKKAGIVKGVVASAEELDESSRKSLSAAIAEKLGKAAELTFEMRPEILGGLVIELDNARIDLSLKTKVDSLSKYALT